jgi:hypothetical protein
MEGNGESVEIKRKLKIKNELFRVFIFNPEEIAEASQADIAMSNTAEVTGGKPMVVMVSSRQP